METTSDEGFETARRFTLQMATMEQPDVKDAARFRWLLARAPYQLAGIAFGVRAACAFSDPVEAIDAAMQAEPLS